MIFQEPMTSLNPVFTIGDQIAEALLLHRPVGRAAARARAVELLDLVGLPAPERQLGRYPHQLSGGQRQRAMIAMALACEPKLLVADEPTTALDVTVQAQILDLLDRLRRAFGMAVLLITHDLGVVAEFCDRVAVMYAGRIVEEAPARDLFARPAHRYTEALLRTIPAANPPGRRLPVDRGQGAAARPALGRMRLRAPLHGSRRALRARPPAPGGRGAPRPLLEPGRMSALLDVQDLSKFYPLPGGGRLRALDGVSLGARRRARCSASSASRAAGNRPSAAPCCASSSRAAAGCCSAARTCSASGAGP